MFRCSHTIFRELIYPCLLKLQFVKIIMVYLCVIKSVVMWLLILVVSLLLCVCRTVRN